MTITNKKHFIDKVYESKEEFDNTKIPKFKVNINNIRDKKEELAKLTTYLPLIIVWEIGQDYVDRADKEAQEHMIRAMKIHQYLSEEATYGEKDLSYELVLKDLYVWITEHPEYKDFITTDG